MSIFPEKGNRYFALSFLAVLLAFVLALVLKSPSVFADVTMVALAGGHTSNAIEKWRAGDPKPEGA